VSDVLDHRDCSEALGAYALGALPDVENERVHQHLASCRPCRAELESLRAAVDALPASVPQIDPPPELKARLMEIVETEADVLQAAGEPADEPPKAASPGPPRRWLPISIPSPGLAVACACVLAVAIVIAIAGSGGTRTIQAQVSGRLLTHGTRATLQLNGTHARLVLTGLPEPAAGHVNELWVKRGTASPQPAGTFVLRTGSVEVGRPVRRGDLVMLTVELAPGTTAPTGVPLIVARA
jgi:anti-sigma factor RsiW